MADYSYNDITEAKRRVQEMKNKIKENGKDIRGSEMLSLISLQKNGRDKALVLTLFYLLSYESDEELIISILNILFN